VTVPKIVSHLISKTSSQNSYNSRKINLMTKS